MPFWVGNRRLVLAAVLSSGKQHTARHAKAAVARLLDVLGDKAPAPVHRDSGYGNEDLIDVCEQRCLSQLLRLRKPANVKRLIELLFRREARTRATEAGQGWQAIEAELRPSSWSHACRVVVALRRRIKHDAELEATKRGRHEAGEQLALAPPRDEVRDSAQVRERTALATNVQCDIAAVAQLHSNRCADGSFEATCLARASPWPASLAGNGYRT